MNKFALRDGCNAMQTKWVKRATSEGEREREMATTATRNQK